MMPAKNSVDAVLDPSPDRPVVVKAGAREQIASAIIRDMFREPKDIPSDMHLLLSGTEDVYAHKGDRLLGLYQILSYSHVFAFRHRMHVRKHKHSDLMEAQFFDIDWTARGSSEEHARHGVRTWEASALRANLPSRDLTERPSRRSNARWNVLSARKLEPIGSRPAVLPAEI